jgi:hypothetical protein
MAENHGFYYADVANAAERGGPMWKVAAQGYEAAGEDLPLITEGVFMKRDHRDRFCANILRKFNGQFVTPAIFYLTESRKLLMERRSNWARRFGELEHEVGSELFDHHVLDGERHVSLEERASFLLNIDA